MGQNAVCRTGWPRARELLIIDPMAMAVQPATARVTQQRARFEALRRRIFSELEHSSAVWRLAWLLPFQIFVVGLLVSGGEPRDRATVQAIVVGINAVLFVARTRSSHVVLRAGTFLSGILGYFVLLATTGGLASPLLILSAMMLSSAAFAALDPRWMRGAVFLSFLLGGVVLALLSHTAVGVVPVPLVGADGAVTAQYVVLALLSLAFVMKGVYRMGCIMTRGYEQAALELAERREELCSENEGRSRALEGMAARLAHEVKNPLAAIKGLSVHMARNAEDSKTAERLAIVAAEADRLQSIVDGFLSFSRGLDDLELAPTRPHEVARELGVLLETRAEEAGVKLAVAGDETLILAADARKLRQALLNLVLNALQASPSGATVNVTVARECEGARITVKDDGVGMTPEVLDRIRKPYFTTKEGGTGLGVAVARGIVEQHGGRLEITSAAGKGTTAAIVLPAKARPCTRLPNPVRADKADKAEKTTEQLPDPVTAGVR
jgi:signal transduction histidine kinase